ncbi:tissue inhibitor of metalloproteinase [Orussus abietinus]|uniref:tissue inhibitor of metalloproteinase n=1 Tax=Orussus abietinus TaxID=222816 RepID=UPI0006254ED9|nr:tissue inhibitor of metalloproteinase [Orussus abietinus]XP_012270739.1 tissue inhibitor of metalloproteinase [Orussus abietinus]XP_012270740.1 tissue inhibitor of metalloproteinase [Orussus abietinus]XP_012270741.1 tissue inhibitor of metalloproteinase [Orussus abietinus]XP_012270742.1 tissue inhibitor of metalloproteinase [Orussus abietinus]
MRWRHYWAPFCLVGLSSLVLPFQEAEACSCVPTHPQTHFCESDFVAVVRVRKFFLINEYEIAYQVKVSRIFKATPKAELALKRGLLLTPTLDAMCGVNLDLGDTYVVSGRTNGDKPTISICGLTLRWSEVTSRQRKGFRQLYRYGCVCEILYTQWWRKGTVLESAGGKRCLWESAPGPQVCQENHGICTPGPGGCHWMPSVPYKNCIKEHRLQRGQQRSRDP